MKVFISGGGGYLASKLVEYFFLQGFKVIVSTRLNSQLDNLNDSVEVFELDYGKIDIFDEVLSDVNLVIHAAGMNKFACDNSPYEAFLFNGVVTSNLINSSIKNKVDYFVFLSSYHVYGRNLINVVNENTPLDCIDAYTMSNKVGEDALLSAIEQNLIFGSVIRISNGFGIPLTKSLSCWDLVVNNFSYNAVFNKQILVKSDFNFIKNYISINEISFIVNFIFHQFLKKDVVVPKIINVSSSNNLDLNNLLKVIDNRFGLLTNKKLIIEYNKNFDNTSKPLTYESLSLKSIHYVSRFDFNFEIDLLLGYCLSKFNNNDSIY